MPKLQQTVSDTSKLFLNPIMNLRNMSVVANTLMNPKEC